MAFSLKLIITTSGLGGGIVGGLTTTWLNNISSNKEIAPQKGDEEGWKKYAFALEKQIGQKDEIDKQKEINKSHEEMLTRKEKEIKELNKKLNRKPDLTINTRGKTYDAYERR